ncbi:polysaccharide biosynthesis C-terminal domain-containing protein [Candidatus Soleaferrea massiliensis]|uniref:oligosaccharide flippase family protein n=1 Tax=Candidatus Soleaferrea massiliensis TaxID=1470354 RepID=UPI0005907A9B|nr:polysaccharide biosynthesis C-terminal domain-containing protein [Candidatus Soleaferrea massiliensis]
MKKIRVFFLNAFILTATSFFMNLIGVWFNLYVTNKIGVTAMGVFQLVMSVYMFAVTLATSGINLATTRLVAEELGRGCIAGVKSAMHKCLAYSAVFGTATAVILFTNAQTIGARFLGNEQTIPALKVLAVSLPFLAMASVLGGYFTAVRRVVKSASTQILEQFVKIGCTMIGLNILMPKGLGYACLAIVLAGTIAQVVSFLLSFLLYFFDSRRYRTTQKPSPDIAKRMFGIALPIAFSSYLRMGLLTVKNLLVPMQLKKSGVSSDGSFAVFGMIQGIVMPVILFPLSILTAFSSLLVPELAECYALNPHIDENRRVHYIMTRMFQAAMLFSIGVCGILFCFSSEIGSALYDNKSVGAYIRIFSVLVPVMYLDNAVDNMLKGLNEQVSSMRYNVIDAFISLVLVYTMLPFNGVRGYICVIFISEILNTALSFNRLITATNYKFQVFTWLVKPLGCIAAATISVRLLIGALHVPFSSGILEAVCVIAGSFVLYLVLLRLTGCYSTEDARWLKGVLHPSKAAARHCD